ncbi:hypothetical protein C0081_01780 [Cohaesibacter celericrescens]|uniref:DUF115 domain-containing protein n=2 Tax=Cohaesibacter celericrescens TaxID=2067669 RepID=A0A2N5XWV8_9HYPH|nr:hypothetical protein C0081_01780 [Cohaesibacter celericrescens]
MQLDIQPSTKTSQLQNLYSGKSVFLVGNAPSLNLLPLDALSKAELPFVAVNNGIRLFKGRPIPFHIVSDIDCFGQNYKSWNDYEIGHGFYRKRFLKQHPSANSDLTYKKTWVPYRNGGILKRGFQPDMRLGIGNDSSVLSFAAQICFYLGFQTIYVIGCDLTYQQGNEYAYEMSEKDRTLEAHEETKNKRSSIAHTDAEFGILHQRFSAEGRQIFNCGIGGNLNAIPRLPFATALLNEKKWQ